MTDQEFADYWTSLVEKKHSTKALLSPDERLFYAANIFRGSVPRSGLIGYFENTEWGVIREAHQALESLGLHEARRLLGEAEEIVLAGARQPAAHERLTLFDDDLSEDEFEQAMVDLENRVSEIQNQVYRQDQAIFDALCRFAEEKSLRAPQG